MIEKISAKERLNWRKLGGLVIFFSVTLVIAIIGGNLIEKIAGQYQLGAVVNPYVSPIQLGWIYFVVPLFVLAGFITFLLPGALIVLLNPRPVSLLEWLLYSFGVSVIATFGLSSVVKIISQKPITRDVFLAGWIGICVIFLLIIALKLRSKTGVLAIPITSRTDYRHIGIFIAIIFIGVWGLFPKIFWENFNLDGIEAFEFGRSLIYHMLPTWDIGSGTFGFYHNFVLMAYPNQWFISLYGPIEAAVRLPFILYLVLILAAVIVLVGLQSKRQVKPIEELFLTSGLLLFAVVLSFNSSYEPYFVDLAEPATTDLLMVLCFLSAAYFLFLKHYRWFYLFAFFTLLSSPISLFLMAVFGLGIISSKSPAKRDFLISLSYVIVIFLIIGIIYELLYTQMLIGGINNQFSFWNTLRRFYPPTLTEYPRLIAFIIASGIIPAVSLFFITREDIISWSFGIVTVVTLLFLYFQTWTNLHQFTLILLLPLVVFWRIVINRWAKLSMWLYSFSLISLLICVYFSLPPQFQINLAIRQFGMKTAYFEGNYEERYAEAVKGSSSLYQLVPEDYRLQYPDQPWGSDAATLLYYASQPKTEDIDINYWIQPANQIAPLGFTLIGNEGDLAVYVKDLSEWRNDLNINLPKVSQASIYEPILRRTFQFFREYAER